MTSLLAVTRCLKNEILMSMSNTLSSTSNHQACIKSVGNSSADISTAITSPQSINIAYMICFNSEFLHLPIHLVQACLFWKILKVQRVIQVIWIQSYKHRPLILTFAWKNGLHVGNYLCMGMCNYIKVNGHS